MKELLSEFKKKKSLWLIGACLAASLVLILIPAEREETSEPLTTTHIEVESYTAMIEEKIVKLCSAVEGVRNPVVLVTLESGTELIYADNKTGDRDAAGASSYTSDYLILDKGDGTEPLLVREVCPRVRGVAVVVHGGDTPVLREKLTDLLSASLGIPTSRIMVTG